jgi:hypothetical protein
MKLKTLCTLYRDYDEDYIEIESPKLWKEHYRVGEHYDFLRKGSVLEVKTKKEYFEDDSQSDGIVLVPVGRCPFVIYLSHILDIDPTIYEIIEN